jgi:hypothetical protein
METRYREHITAVSETVSEEIRNLLGLTPDAYLELKHELSFAWMNTHKFQSVSRILAVSTLFYRWWFQAVAWREHEILKILKTTKRGRRDTYAAYISNISIYPPSVVYNNIVNEGLAIITENPSLNLIRL